MKKKYELIKHTRSDNVECFFFKIDGETRHSSYDAQEISDFAYGYMGCTRRLKIQDRGPLPVRDLDPLQTAVLNSTSRQAEIIATRAERFIS